MDVSVVIPSRQERMGLWATIASARADLEQSGLEFEIVPVINGEVCDIASHMHSSAFCSALFAGDAYASPQHARALGVRMTTGNTIFFLDSHVLVAPGFFLQMLADMDETGADLMHSPHRFTGPRTYYGSAVSWDEYLWTAQTIERPPVPGKPFKIALGGHGGVAIRRKSYEKSGGYWLALKSFGGEETQLNFKLWMLGMSCWMTPRTHHWHWLPTGERRNESIFYDRDFVRNFLMISAAYGDAERVRKSWEAMKIMHWKFESRHEDLLASVLSDPAVLAERADIQARGVYKNVNELRAFFNSAGVVN